MCRVYASTDAKRYTSTTRSLRLQGCVTSVRLENEFWETLEALAAEQGESVAAFISDLYGEVVEERGEVANLSSMLRVTCAIYLQRRAATAAGRSAPSAERCYSGPARAASAALCR